MGFYQPLDKAGRDKAGRDKLCGNNFRVPDFVKHKICIFRREEAIARPQTG